MELTAAEGGGVFGAEVSLDAAQSGAGQSLKDE